MFGNLKIAKKLGIGFGVVLVLLICVILIYRHAIQSATQDFQKLIENEIAMASHAGNIEKFILESRKNEKNFLLFKRHYRK